MNTTTPQVAGLLVLSAVGAELLAAYDDSTGHAGALLFAVVFYAALYGAPALLIREVARRRRWRWPSIVLLACAAGTLQAGVIDQSLFSAAYRDLDGWRQTRAATFVAPLGIGAHMTLAFVIGHAVYSFGAPIALVEAWRPGRADVPWLRLPATLLAAAAYLAAAALIMAQPESASASAPQVAGALCAASACVAAAVCVGRRAGPRGDATGRAPGLVLTAAGACALALVSAVAPETWAGVALNAAVVAIAAISLTWASRRSGWSLRHPAAAALGVLLSRGVLAFTYAPLFGEVSPARKYTHNVVMLLLVAAAGWLALRGRGPAGDASVTPSPSGPGGSPGSTSRC